MKRRTFIKRTLLGGGLLLGASGVYLGVRGSGRRAKPTRRLYVLDEEVFAVVVALAERTLMFQGADHVDVAHRIDEALRYAALEGQQEFLLMAKVLENSLAGLLLRGSSSLFTEAEGEARDVAIRRFRLSPVKEIRGFTNSARKLTLANHYAQLPNAEAVGYPAPLINKPEPPKVTPERALSPPAQGVIEGQTLGSDVAMDADVCIVGSGAGGAVTASILARAGKKVLILEEGGYFTSDRFRVREEECYPDLYQEAAQRTTKDAAIAVFQGRAVGGTTVVNWTTSFRTPDHVLEHWAKRWKVQGFSMADLEPHYQAVEERLSIAEIPLELVNRNNRLLWDGCEALGLKADLLKRNVKQCAQTGFCGYGCPIDAKQSMLVTYLPDALAQGATLVSRARVDRLMFDGASVSEVQATLIDAPGLAPTGRRLSVKAKTFILSAGAIGSPTILLRSGAPDPDQRVGRRTFLHPVVASLGLYDEPVNGYHGAPQSVSSHHFAHRGDEVGYFLEAAPIQPLLFAISVPGFGGAHRQLMEQIDRGAAHIALTIDGHHEEVVGGTVSLRPSGAPLLDYPIVEKQWAAMREAHKTLARIQLETGAHTVLTTHADRFDIKSQKDLAKIDAAAYGPSQLAVFSAHQMGGCMMSDDKNLGVVRSSDLRHHHVDNLHIIDGSVFPTSLGVNPQESIYGLAHLIAQRI